MHYNAGSQSPGYSNAIFSELYSNVICNSYTMGCLPVRGDNPRAFFFYTIYICIDLADDETFRAEVGNGGIKIHISTWGAKLQSNNITYKYILAAFPIHINAIRMWLSIKYFRGYSSEFPNYYVLKIPKIGLTSAKSVDPDEMQHYAAFHLGLHCLPKNPFRVSSIQWAKALPIFNKHLL